MINQLNVQSGSAESETFRKKYKSKEKKILLTPLCLPAFSLCKLHVVAFSSQNKRKVYSDDEDLAALLANIYMQLPLRKTSHF